MKVILVRHGEKGGWRPRDKENPKGPGLNEIGRASAHRLHAKFVQMGIDFSQPVAVSELLRAQQTAIQAGSTNLLNNTLLNEINTDDREKTKEMVKKRLVPEIARQAAKKLLANPPKQKIWFTHGLVVATLLDELGYIDRQDYVLGFADCVEIEI